MMSVARKVTELPRIAICFFGITRSLGFTIHSIETNIIEAARQIGPVTIFSHFFQQGSLYNPRTGEKGVLNANEHELLNSDWIELEKPQKCLSEWDFEGLKSYGDTWNDDFTSMRNLVHQLHSLNTVASRVLLDDFDICIFARPDLEYQDHFGLVLTKAINGNADTVYLPHWQPWRGLNDRFAICRGKKAIAAYGQRVQFAHSYCKAQKRSLNSEMLVSFALKKSDTSIRRVGLRATRVRIDGSRVKEDFSYRGVRPFILRTIILTLRFFDRRGFAENTIKTLIHWDR